MFLNRVFLTGWHGIGSAETDEFPDMKRLFAYSLVIFCLFSCIKDKPLGAELAVGDRIPDFVVTMNDGTEVSGEDLREGVSVIMFFTTGCPDCRQTLPEIQKLYDEYLPQGVHFALISREEGAETIGCFWEEQGLTMPYSAQRDRSVYELFAKTRVPRVYITEWGTIKSIFTDIPETPSYEAMKEAVR